LRVHTLAQPDVADYLHVLPKDCDVQVGPVATDHPGRLEPADTVGYRIGRQLCLLA
jgi:hypothetical protein